MDDQPSKQYADTHPVRNVAVAGLVNPIGRILLVRTHALPTKWQPVGGGIEPGETSEAALAREVQEELSITIDPLSSLFSFTAPYDFGEGNVYFFTIPIDESTVSRITANSEIIEVQWFTLAQALDLPCYPATRTYLQAYAQERT